MPDRMTETEWENRMWHLLLAAWGMTGGASRRDYVPGRDKETHTQEVWRESLMALDSCSCLMAKNHENTKKCCTLLCLEWGRCVHCMWFKSATPPSDLVGGDRWMHVGWHGWLGDHSVRSQTVGGWVEPRIQRTWGEHEASNIENSGSQDRIMFPKNANN